MAAPVTPSLPTKGQPLVCPGHKSSVVKLCFSAEVDDELFLASACHDRTAMLRDGKSGDWVGTFEAHRGALWDVCINPDGTKVVTGGADFTARVWDATTGDIIETRLFDHAVKVAQLHGDSLVVAGNAEVIQLFDLANPAVAPAKAAKTPGRIARGAFTKEGQFVAAGAAGASVWDLSTDALQPLALPAAGVVQDLEVAGALLLVALPDAVLLFDVSGALPALKHHLAIPGGGVRAAALNPLHARGMQQVLTAENSGNLRLWDFQGQPLADELKGHTKAAVSVRFAPNGVDAASGSDDHSVRMWPVQDRVKVKA